MTLTHLSLVHVPPRTSVPAPLSNADRLREFRAAAEPVIGNGWRWGHLPRRESAPDYSYFTSHSYADLAGGF